MGKLAEDYADRLSQEISEVMAAVAADVEIDGQPAVEYLDEWPLEIVARVGAPFQVVLTVGGPDARVWCHLDSEGDVTSAELLVRWDGPAVRESAAINELAEYFAEFYRGAGSDD